MGRLDPIEWPIVEQALGPPAEEITKQIERLQGDLRWKNPYEAVKTVHDALDEADIERSVPGLGEPFITAYLLEKRGLIILTDEAEDEEYRSLVERRLESEHLERLLWDRKRTLWWIGMIAGVHPSLVTYWCWEDDIPLMERNFTAESMEKIRAHRETDGG